MEILAEAHASLERLQQFSLQDFLAVLWKGVQHVQILADESKIEIPFLQNLPKVVKVIMCFLTAQLFNLVSNNSKSEVISLEWKIGGLL